MPSEIYFFKKFLLKSWKSLFYVSAVNSYCTYILKVPTKDSLVFFSEHISKTAILTQASVITCVISGVFLVLVFLFILYIAIFQRLI